MPSGSAPIDQFYKVVRERLEVALDSNQVVSPADITAWAGIATSLYAMDPERNPRRLAASAYQLAQQGLHAQDNAAALDELQPLAAAMASLQTLLDTLSG